MSKEIYELLGKLLNGANTVFVYSVTITMFTLLIAVKVSDFKKYRANKKRLALKRKELIRKGYLRSR